MLDLVAFDFDVALVNPQGKEIDRSRNSVQYLIEDLRQEITLEMVAIPGGTFLMGTPNTEEGWSPTQNPQHLVTIKPFFMGKYPVTQAQWQAVATLPEIKQFLNPDPSTIKEANLPVEQISWYDAIEFCDRLSKYSGRKYRLPSEAEWEYACRSGTQTPFHFGETCTTDLANYSGIDWEYMGKICSRGSYGAGPKGSDRRETTPVGYFQVANRCGLYDMHGNVREWCADFWHDNYQDAPTDGTVWTTDGDSNKRVLRGGSWNTGPRNCRSAFRAKFDANASLYDIGFRVAFF
ncbi:formylglycine-generating enzyme family protein [Argonema galeatum]|uniref:formylglycine-generating enzyme family protein n=1 Tax=Argonema galeatum TaxID=2942762 RepID=UPI002010D786|nr:formylglycine-generating enzyme family protein [Argonema galeatum]MCL1464537.1 formylglycine-generating enzyme family protein [Argonema galeatum A003/A1]